MGTGFQLGEGEGEGQGGECSGDQLGWPHHHVYELLMQLQTIKKVRLMEHRFYYFHRFVLDRFKVLCACMVREPTKTAALPERFLHAPSCVPYLLSGGAT